jgi:hypothetical protein
MPTSPSIQAADTLAVENSVRQNPTDAEMVMSGTLELCRSSGSARMLDECYGVIVRLWLC